MLLPIKRLLKKELRSQLSEEELSLLPSSYQKIGDIVILNIKSEISKHSPLIGKMLLKQIPNTRTVCVRTDFIRGLHRQPQVRVVAGDKNTETVHKEHGVLYKLDVKKVMFAKGNLNERKRMTELIKPNETVVDMFAGIGYFSIPIVKLPQTKRVYSIEVNPIAYHYLLENIKPNHVEDKLVPILGDCSKEVLRLGKIADRVIMGLLPSSKQYLSSALKVVKKNGIIHYHGLEKSPENLEDDLKSRNMRVLRKIKVKSYAPRVHHIVLDCRVL